MREEDFTLAQSVMVTWIIANGLCLVRRGGHSGHMKWSKAAQVMGKRRQRETLSGPGHDTLQDIPE